MLWQIKSKQTVLDRNCKERISSQCPAGNHLLHVKLLTLDSLPVTSQQSLISKQKLVKNPSLLPLPVFISTIFISPLSALLLPEWGEVKLVVKLNLYSIISIYGQHGMFSFVFSAGLTSEAPLGSKRHHQNMLRRVFDMTVRTKWFWDE